MAVILAADTKVRDVLARCKEASDLWEVKKCLFLNPSGRAEGCKYSAIDARAMYMCVQNENAHNGTFTETMTRCSPRRIRCSRRSTRWLSPVIV